MRIRKKLITIIMALSIIPMVFVSYCIFNTAKRNLQDNILLKLQSITKAKVDTLETFVAEHKSDLIVLRQRNVIKTTFPVLGQFSRDQHNLSYIEAKRTLDRQLKILQTAYEYANVLLLNKDGEVIYVSSHEHGETDLEKYMSGLDEAVFQKDNSGVYIGDALKTNCKEHPYVMVMAGALYDDENKFIGSVCLALDLSATYKIVCDNTGLGQSGETFLVKKTPDNRVLFLSPLKQEQDTVLKKTVSLGADVAVPSQNAAEGKTGSGIYTDYHGQEALSVWQPVPSLEWGMVAKIDTKEAFGQIKKLQDIVIVILIITIPVILLTALTIAKSISDPIHHLHRGTEIIGSGNLDYKVGTDAKDEIGQLSRAFDTMTENLKNTTTSIESLNKEVVKRKWAETVVQTEKDNLKAIFETAPVGMILLNKKAEVVKINGVIEKLVGEYRHGEQPGDLFKCIHSLETSKGCGYSSYCSKCPIRNAITTVLQNGLTVHCAEVMTTLLINDKETNVWLEINAEPITLDGEKCVILAINNITDRKQAEEALRVSEQFAYATLDAISANIAILDETGTIVAVNRAWRTFAKENLPENSSLNVCEGINYLSVTKASVGLNSEEAAAMVAGIHDVMSGKLEKFTLEYPCHSPNEKRWFNVHVTKFAGEESGNIVIAHENITARKLADEALKESEEKYKMLYESSQDAIMMILPSEKKFLGGNPATIKLFGCEDENEFTSLSPADLSPKYQPDGTESSVKSQEMMKTAMEKGSHFFEWMHKRMDGTEFDATVLVTRIELKGKKTLQATVRDITESKKAEKEMKEAVEMKSKFISTASHELRTPLTAIKESINLVYTEMTGPINDNQKEFLGIAKRNVDRLARLINDVLDYQKMTAGKMDFNLQPAGINETVRLVEETMRPLAKEKGLNLIIELDDAVPMVNFDKDKIVQVLINLINNAIKFTDKGSIKITTAKRGDDIIIAVKDSGCGIKKEDMPKLFQEFEQLSTKDADRKTGGTGLGLAISKKIVEKHNGRIWAESEYEKGTTFYFTLPAEAILCPTKS